MSIPPTPPRDLVAELRAFDAAADEDLSAIDWVLSVPWNLQIQHGEHGIPRAIVYAGDAQDPTLIFTVEHASVKAIAALTQSVLSHNASLDRTHYETDPEADQS